MQNYGWNKAPRGWHDVRWRDMWDDVMCGVTWCHRSNLTEQNARQVYKGHGGKETEPSVKTLWPKAPKKEALQHWAVVYDLFVLLGNKSVGYIFSSLRWKKKLPYPLLPELEVVSEKSVARSLVPRPLKSNSYCWSLKRPAQRKACFSTDPSQANCCRHDPLFPFRWGTRESRELLAYT